jgi:arylsulfatase A-like enzyme
MMTRFLFALVCLSLGGPFSSQAAQQPNVLVILADDLGRADYSAFGTRDIQTPHLDRLCAEGMTFHNFRANSCVCSPTRAALLSGCHPDRVGVPGVIREEEPVNSWGHLAPGVTLLPKVLKKNGYHSALIGKWHLGISSPNTPNEQGFDFFHGFLGDMMDDYWSHLRHGHNLMRRNVETISPNGHATDLFTDWACDYLAERSREGEPFFLYLAYNAPHDPVQPPPEWLERVRKREPGLGEKRAALVALIEHMDAGIGRVLDTLDKLHLAGNTLVFFTSDNGGLLPSGANNGPWRSGKTHMYEGGLRVPAIARWPGKIKPGTQSDRNCLTMDLFPTICDAAGVPQPAGLDSESFLPTLLGKTHGDPERDHYFVRREGGPQYGGKTIEALIHGDWKLVQDSPFAPLELFNLRADPTEAHNLAGSEPHVLKELSTRLRRHIQRGGTVGWQKPAQPLPSAP